METNTSFNLGSTASPGSPVGLSIEGARLAFHQPDPDWPTWELDGSGSLNELLEIHGREEDMLTANERRMFEKLGACRASVLRALPKEVLVERLALVSGGLRAVDESGYLPSYMAGRRLLDSLRPSDVDPSISSYPNKKDFDVDGLLNHYAMGPVVPRYSMASTTTGRLTITRGPNFLTAPKWVRRFIRSTSGLPVWELDVTALEPTVLFSYQLPDFDPGDDLYAAVSDRWFAGSLPRDVAKQLVISLCYGARERSLAALTAVVSGNQRPQIKSLRSDLRLDRFAADKREQLESDGHITNALGRPIRPKDESPRDGVLVNNFVQSSAVDIALSAFSTACEAWDIEPLLVIHDALYFSAEPKVAEELRNLGRVTVPELSVPLKFTVNRVDE